MSSKKHTRKSSGRISSSNHRSTLSLQKTEVVINVYDLLPPGRFSTVLWTLGSSLLHSGVVLNGREYAFGGHDKRGATGVYYSKPKSEPPGGTFRCEILQGFTLSPQPEIENIIKEASEAFLGTQYNLLTKNCNHFTSYLCQKLTGRPGPAWLNRAASIGVALPCVVPQEWISPPEYDETGEHLLDEDEDGHHTHERASMLGSQRHERHSIDTEMERSSFASDDPWDSEDERRRGGSGKGKGPLRDTSGRIVPPADRAPTPR